MIVDGAVIDQRAAGIDDEHVWRRLGAIEMPQRSTRIHEYRRRRGIHGLQIFVFLRRSNKALRSRRGRDHGKPHYAFTGPFFLQALHVPALIMLPGVWAALVVPLQDHKLTLIAGEALLFAIA